MLNLIDEHTRESLLVRPERRWSSARVIEALADVMVAKGVPEHIRSDNGPEFVAKDLRKWLADTGAKTLYIEPGSPWENPAGAKPEQVIETLPVVAAGVRGADGIEDHLPEPGLRLGQGVRRLVSTG
jgi:hypothetical protein